MEQNPSFFKVAVLLSPATVPYRSDRVDHPSSPHRSL